MSTPLLLLALSLAAVHAGAPGQSPKTLAELVDLAMKEGKEEALQPEMAGKLGLGSQPIPKRKLRFKQSTCPDRKEHTFGVLYESAEGKEDRPTGLYITTGAAKKAGDVLLLDGFSYFADLKGNLKRAFRHHGPMGHLQDEPLVVDTAAKRRLRSELEFHRKVAPSLGLKPAT